MPLAWPVTERRMELSWLTYSKYDKSSGVGDGDGFLKGGGASGDPSKSDCLQGLGEMMAEE